jgi:ring-1,2-phenylacetyl-CoA epoxidase subunit PaaD
MDELTEVTIWRALEAVKDPEIPVVSVVEMGIVREVTVVGERVTVKMTPTFSGCPALDVMRRDIQACVLALGAREVHVETVLSPAVDDRVAQRGNASPPKGLWPFAAAPA